MEKLGFGNVYGRTFLRRPMEDLFCLKMDHCKLSSSNMSFKLHVPEKGHEARYWKPPSPITILLQDALALKIHMDTSSDVRADR